MSNNTQQQDSQHRRAVAWSAVAAMWLTACGGGGGGTSAGASGGAAGSGGTQVTLATAQQAEPETFTDPQGNGPAAPDSGATPVATAPAPAAPTPAAPAAPTPPAPASEAPAAPAPSTPATCVPGTTGDVTSGEVQAGANGSYTVTAASGEVVVTLPANACLQPGQRVRITGQGGAAWRLAQNPQQYVMTIGLPGNRRPGGPGTWTARAVTGNAATSSLNWSANASSASGNRIAAAASGGGIYISQDGGATWTASNAPTAAWSALSMAPEGDRLAAVAANGLLYTSVDHGLTWQARTTAPQSWASVHISSDGQRIAAVANDGQIQLSTDGGASFTPVASVLPADWRGISGSSDGLVLVAVAARFGQFPARHGVYVSQNGGSTWTRATTVDAGVTNNDNWSFVASSYSGQRMAALDNGSNPWVSDDYGRTWTARFSYSNWSGVAVSGDGTAVAALEPRDDAGGHTGYVFLSRDGGHDWPFPSPPENRWYWGASLSMDGNWVVAGDRGPRGAGGLIYTSQGNRTSGGTLGFIGGGQGQTVEVVYEGNGRFSIGASAGGAFTIR